MNFLYRLGVSFLILLSFSLTALGGNKIKYPASTIPKVLLHGAKAVMRTKTVVYERTGLSSAHQQLTYAVTILNKGGATMGKFIQFYDKFSHIGNISAVVYDEYGHKVKKIKKEDVVDVVADFGRSLYSDTRIKYIDPEYDNFPFTVEYSCAINYSGNMEIPSWQVYPNYDMSIEKEDFTMITPNPASNPGQGIYYFANDTSLRLRKKTEKGKTIYSLHIENLSPIDEERFSPRLINRSPTLFFAPVAFTISGYNGGFTSWKSFGDFINSLNKGRDILPEKTQVKIKSLVAGQTDKREIIKTLYQYMQDKVRYVSVQKGIGGWQPITAEKVDELSYGDCKALTNYMKSLLETVGIPAKYTLVRAGTNAPPVKTLFPSNRFNHAILCVPVDMDTLWLECTNQHIPCGYLGSFTDDRNVLVIDNTAGAKIAHTKTYGKNENIRNRHSEIQFDTDGSCVVNSTTENKGLFYDRQLPLSLANRELQKREILKQLHFPTVHLKEYHFKEEKDKLPLIRSQMDVAIPKYAVNMGNRLLFDLYLYSGNNNMVFKHKKRHSPLIIRRSYTTIDSLVYILPVGYIPASLPKAQTVTSPFGTYYFHIDKSPGKIVFVRRLEVNKGDFPPSDYEQFMAFYKKTEALDSKKVVLMKTK